METPAMPPATKPGFRFTHSKALRTRTLKLLDAVDSGDDPVAQRDALGEHIVELTDAGLHFFFAEPVAKLKMGFVVNQAAGLGLGSVLRVMGPTIRNIVGRMDAKQLRSLSRIMRQMMV
jgi:hypothetical protein